MRTNSKQKVYVGREGFIATTAVVMLAYSILAVHLAVMSAVSAYVDSVYLREMRIQARHSLFACLSYAEVFISRDYLWRGKVDEGQADGCVFDIENNPLYGSSGKLLVSVYLNMGAVKMRAQEEITLEDFRLKVESRAVED